MSYTDEQIEIMTEEYLEAPCRETVHDLAERFGKSPRSITAKLSSLDVYQTPIRTTKTGDAIEKKDEMTAQIEGWLGIVAPSLSKTSKLELRALRNAIQEIVEE